MEGNKKGLAKNPVKKKKGLGKATTRGEKIL